MLGQWGSASCASRQAATDLLLRAELQTEQCLQTPSKRPNSSLYAPMEVAFTFGSLGDIIELSQLAIQLGRAVGVASAAGSGASAREYQDLRQDLDLFVHVLMQASNTTRN